MSVILLLMERFVQWMRTLIAPGNPITCDENRCVAASTGCWGSGAGRNKDESLSSTEVTLKIKL